MASERVKLNGFLEFNTTDDGWLDTVTLYDEGAQGKMGCVPLSMKDFQKFHGKEVNITIELAEARHGG